MDVHVKFGDSRSNGTQDIRAILFVMDDERQATADAGRDIRQQVPHQLVGHAKRLAAKIPPKAVRGCILAVLKCRPEVADDVISNLAVD